MRESESVMASPNGTAAEVDDALLAAVCGIAREAGEIVMRHYALPEARTAVSRKSDASPVTRADREASAHIVRRLAALVPGVPIVSEEEEIPGWEVRRAWRRFWLVDPLDGTKEFISANGEFTVNIALVDDGEPVLGAVLAPALDLLYFARRDGGAWRQEGGAPPERVYSRARGPGEGRIVVESRSHPSPELEAYLASITVERRIPIGSSLKFCWLADGRADLYPRLGPTMEWDVAAGDCVYRAAGRAGANPSPLRYNKPDLRNDAFVLGA